MYNVIIISDEKRNKNYYWSYVEEDGNIVCEDLPPYQDILKARACYWDSANEEWIFDNEKYNENVANEKAKKEAEEQAQKEADAIPSNAELSAAIMELAENISDIEDAITEIGQML